MIRPRGGDFTYSKEEIEIMKQDINICKQIGVDGVVFGVLKENKIDYELTKELASLASPLKVTVHMAFDEVEN